MESLNKHPAGLMGWANIVAFGLLLAMTGAAWAAAGAVGEVSFAIGVTRLIDGAGRANAVVRGMSVHAGDRVETEQGGHVHLRFVDGAFVSVRPGSRLFIETYRYDAAHPENSAIRFRLEHGVARAISGKGAESAREHFRLNTPIAAIGVKGTDFVVQAELERVRVAVHSGAIILAPLGEGCAANALGPCVTAAARMLSADMGQVMLEFQRQQGVPRLIPVNGVLPPDRVNPPVPEEYRGGTRGASGEVLAAQAVSPAVLPAPPPAPAPAPPPPPPPPPPTLVWGRWTTEAWPGDTLSQARAEVRSDYQGTVSNSQYTLFRPESPLSALVSNLGQVDFTLRDAQVHFVRGVTSELGRVDSGWLSVDFAARQFATGLSMSHPQVGAATLQAAGSVRDDGIFVVRTSDGRVGGALTLDGKEAGYYFERSVPGGNFVGITRWGR